MASLFSRLGGHRDSGHPEGACAASGDLPRPLDTKAFSKLYKRMDRVVKSLQNSRMNLSRSPPCLIDTLPDIYVKLKEVNSFYELPEKKAALDRNDFFYITVNNIFDKCKRVNLLFKEHREDMYCEASDSRKQLINLTIVIAYIYHDLKALFPDAQFNPNFRIAKEEAEHWWKDNFRDKIIVPWSAFRERCNDYFRPPLSKLDLSKLKSTIDLTCNDHVSIFEFDVFTRLFAPWSMLIKTFQKLTFHTGFMASATFENVKAILSRHKDKPGSYVFRMSCTKLGFWSIGYVTDHPADRKEPISQIVVRDGKAIVEALEEGRQKGFYLYPNGEPHNPDLSDLLHERVKSLHQVTEDQHDEYSRIGSSYEECKICNLRDKDVKLDLCGHLLCGKCLNQWLTKGIGCPFCRTEIRSTQPIVIKPFKPPTSPSDRPPPSHPPPPLPAGYPQHSPPARRRSSTSASSPIVADPANGWTAESPSSPPDRSLSSGPVIPGRLLPLPPTPQPPPESTSSEPLPSAARNSSSSCGGTYVNVPIRDAPLPPRPAVPSLPEPPAAAKPTSLALGGAADGELGVGRHREARRSPEVAASSAASALMEELRQRAAGSSPKPPLLTPKPRQRRARKAEDQTTNFRRSPVSPERGAARPKLATESGVVEAVSSPRSAPVTPEVLPAAELTFLPPAPPPPIHTPSPVSAPRWPPAVVTTPPDVDPQLATLPPPPPPPIEESAYNVLPPPAAADDDEYNVLPDTSDLYNVPGVEYSIPAAQDGVYNTPLDNVGYMVPPDDALLDRVAASVNGAIAESRNDIERLRHCLGK